MRIATILSVLSVLALVPGATPEAAADEGQWTPDQLRELEETLAAKGLERTVAELWSAAGDERTGGLMRAVVNYGGCTASFISPEGLLATNHHCAYGALQSNSTPESDYLSNGFVARSRDQELEAKGRTVKVLVGVEDVTQAIRGPADAASSDEERQALIERTRKQLVEACESGNQEGLRCQVASFYNGSQYRLFKYLEIVDIRIVYAPPAAIGEYGGEVDNWMWPRHTGDFTLLRAYVGKDGTPAPYSNENVPYQPGQYLRVSTEGVSPGDFAAILGYPGRTNRYLPAAEIERQIEQVLPFKVDFYGEWIGILEDHGKRDDAVRIKVAALLKRLANRHKNARGMLDGLDHMKLHQQRLEDERALRAFAADKPEYQGVLDELSALVATSRAGHIRGALLREMSLGPNTLALGIDLVRKTRAARLPDLERPEEYQEREWDRLWRGIERHLRDHDPGVDAELLASLLARNAALPQSQRIPALDRLAETLPRAQAETRADFLDLATRTVTGSKLADAAAVEALWRASDPAALDTSDDPMLVLARGIADTMEAREREERAHDGALARLRPTYFDMLKSVRQGPIYPDANGTLRLSYATVQGYDKWDGRAQKPQTVLAGAVRKHTGEDPFDLPQRVRQHASSASRSNWADTDLGDLGLCFLSNGDTTGGNSGSPVIDGKGRLIGLNFDRVWENIAGDFSYFQGHSRNVNVDIRYLLWMLDQVDDADHILAELGVAEMRGDRPPSSATAADESKPKSAEATTSRATKSGCGCHGGNGPSSSLFWLLVLAGVLVLTITRRRQRA